MNGMAMLIYQGLLAFEIFMDVRLNYAEEYSRIYPLCRDRLIKIVFSKMGFRDSDEECFIK